MNKLSKLSSLVAFILTNGRVIEFRFDELPLDNVRGLAFRDGSNGVVLVDDCLGDEQTFKTVIHEISHCKQDWHVLMDVKHIDRLRGRYLSELPVISKERHKRSYDQTGEWLAVADRICPDGDCSAKLAALAKHYFSHSGLW